MDRTVLVAGNNYLVQEVNDDGKLIGGILEWECLEVSDFAVKVQNKVVSKNRYSLFSDDTHQLDEPFWVLKNKISDLTDGKYKIIETLKTNK